MIQATKQPRNVKVFVLAVLVLFAHVLSACAAPAAPGDAPAAPASATKSNPKDGAEYVYVPAGPFIMGSTEEQINDALRTCQKLIPTLTSHLRCQRSEFEREAPHSTIEVDGFWIMRTEVTNGQYNRCVAANGCRKPHVHLLNDPAYVDHPVRSVSWNDANDYAAWAGGRLPTEAEWEKACRGTDGSIYPWGTLALHNGLANFAYADVGDTTPVGEYSPQGDSSYGLADMAGNVWEWTSSQYQPYPYDATDGREIHDEDASRTLRGSAWYGVRAGDTLARCAYRFDSLPNNPGSSFGFRLVMP